MQLAKLQGLFDPVKYIFIYNFIFFSVVFEIWLKCTAECTDKHSWKTEVYLNIISIETCMPCI